MFPYCKSMNSKGVCVKNLSFDKFIDFYQNPVNGPSCLNPQLVAGEGRNTVIYRNSSVEPYVIANPVNKAEAVAAWQLGRISNAGALEIGIAYTKNYGRNWIQTLVPLQLCLGGVAQRLSDPWLDWSVDGSRVHLSALAIVANQPQGGTLRGGIIATYSENGGQTWSQPQFLTSSAYTVSNVLAGDASDKNSISVDSNDPCLVYVTGDVYSFATNHSYSIIVRSLDNGTSWTQPRSAYDGTFDLYSHGLSYNNPSGNQTINNIIVSLPYKKQSCHERCDRSLSGDLLLFMNRIYANPNLPLEQFVNGSGVGVNEPAFLSDIAVVRSKDHGVTWKNVATVVTTIDYNLNVIYTGGYVYNAERQPVSGLGKMLRNSNSAFSVAVNRVNGYLYLVFADSRWRSDSLSQIGLTVSRDGGLTWEEPVRVNRTPQNAINPQAFTPSVTVTPCGYVAITYFDLRADTEMNPSPDVQYVAGNGWLVIYKDTYQGEGCDCEVEGDGGKYTIHTKTRGYNCCNNQMNTHGDFQFITEFSLTCAPFNMVKGPVTGQGIMVDSDYTSVSSSGNVIYAAYIVSTDEPVQPQTLLTTVDGANLYLNDSNLTKTHATVVAIK